MTSRNRPPRRSSRAAQASDEKKAAQSWVTVGRIAGAYGLAGEVKVDMLTDFPKRFSVDSRLYLQGEPMTITRSFEVNPGRVVVRLSGVTTREQAAALQGSYVEIPESEVAPLPPGSYYRFQLVGLEAYTDSGERLGKLADIIPTGSNDVLVVRPEQGPDILIPNVAHFADIDLDAKQLIVHPAPGLLPEPAEPRKEAHRTERR